MKPKRLLKVPRELLANNALTALSMVLNLATVERHVAVTDKLLFVLSPCTIAIRNPRQVAAGLSAFGGDPFSAYFDALTMLVNTGRRVLDMVVATLQHQFQQGTGVAASITYEDEEEITFTYRSNVGDTRRLLDLKVQLRRPNELIDVLTSGVVFYSLLQEIVTAQLGYELGTMYFEDPNAIIRYDDLRFKSFRNLQGQVRYQNPYLYPLYRPDKELLGTNVPIDKLIRQLRCLTEREGEGLTCGLLVRNGLNMLYARSYLTQGDYSAALRCAKYVAAFDWRAACVAYILETQRKAEPCY